MAGMGVNKLRGGTAALGGYKKEPLVALTTGAAVLACVHAYYGFRKVKDETDKAVDKAAPKKSGGGLFGK